MQQPSQTAIERELEALRDIRRRSTAQGGPGALLLDPDLPAEQPTKTPPLSPQAWTSDEQQSPRKDTDNASTSSSSGEGSTQLADDPFHLFWVPAHLHPELAPKEFKMFLKEHARGPVEGSSALLSRSSSASSVGSGGLGRKRSMLSRPYKPREGESTDDEEHILPIRRNRSVYGQDGPKLTISDLQKLEELADEASKSDDPSKLRRVIRRSLSLNVAPSSVLDSMDDVPDAGDDADAPIIVPKPNQILRRAARTKIRKPGLADDGSGHRFPAARRRKSARAATIDAHPTHERSSGEISDFDSHRRPPLPNNRRSEEDSDEAFDQRRNTFTDIYDAYTDGPDDMHHLRTSPPPMPVDRPVSPPPPVPPIPPLPTEPTLHQPQPQRPLSPVLQQQPPEPARSPSPDSPASVTASSMDELHRVDPRTSEPAYAGSPPSLGDKRKEKEKKSILKKWGGGSDKSAKKNGKEKEREKDKEKDSGFFGSLFGKKSKDEPATTLGTGSGPATAAALLGASKTSKGYTPSLSPQLGNPYARYPIHVERAVYRLSHIKLANPRRPLYEQVLISNLMFWYLGVINKAQQGPAANGTGNVTNQAPAQVQQVQANAQGVNVGPSAQLQQEQRENETSEWQKRQEQERERPSAPEPKRDGRRGSLTKTPQPGSSAAAGRRAEMPVKGPEYGLQHQVIEQEYGPGPPTVGGSGRPGSSPPQGGAPSSYTNRGGYAPRANPQPVRQQMASRDMYAQQDGGYYGQPSGDGREGIRSPSPGRSGSPSQGLPPGAMNAPMPGEQAWFGSAPRATSPPSQRAADYSSNDWLGDWGLSAVAGSVEGGAKLPARSLSANAVPVNNNAQHANLRKKVNSVTAVDTNRRPRSSDGNEEEDVPLAVWQQQRRR